MNNMKMRHSWRRSMVSRKPEDPPTEGAEELLNALWRFCNFAGQSENITLMKCWNAAEGG
ncbi:MAG: hypothetical protein ACTS6G_03685 [Candidatus Hodgkinia cicadicola]